MKYILLLYAFFYVTIVCGQGDQHLPDSVEIKDNNIPLRMGPYHESEIIRRISSKTKFALLGVKGEYLKVKKDEIEGYVFHMFVKIDSQGLKKILNENTLIEKAKKNEREDSIAKEKFRLEQLMQNEIFQKKLADMTGKYGKEIGQKIAFGHVWIGMTEEMLIESLGNPINKNRTIVSGLEKIQYVYGNGKYVYVENKKVTGYQD